MKTIVNYAQKVKEQHALNKTLAPVETDLTSASKAYAVGQKFIHDGVLYQAKTAIAQGAALVLNTNYEAADDVSSEIEALTNNLSDEVEVRAKLGAHNLVDIDGFTLIKSSARTKYIYPSDIIHGAIPSEQVVISFKVTNSNLSKSDNYFKAYGSNGEIGAVSFKANGRYSFVFDGASFNNFYIFISSNAESDETCTISEIMITLATDAYSEYTPYAMTNQELTAENQTLTNNIDILIENGAVNKLPNNATTQTITGIQITVNADKSMTISGSGNSATVDIFNDANNPIIISEDCKFSCGATFTSSTCEIVATATDNTTYSLKLSTGNSITIPAGKEIKKVTWYNNASYNETLTIYPMIADADYSGGYVPYAMTNRELTELAIVGDLSSQVTLTENCFSCSLLRQSNTCHVNVAVKSGINGFTSVATIPTDLKPKYNTPMACFAVAGADSSKIADAVLNTNGLISIRTTSATSDIAYLACTWIV